MELTARVGFDIGGIPGIATFGNPADLNNDGTVTQAEQDAYDAL